MMSLNQLDIIMIVNIIAIIAMTPRAAASQHYYWPGIVLDGEKVRISEQKEKFD
jgi:hypothetical protein